MDYWLTHEDLIILVIFYTVLVVMVGIAAVTAVETLFIPIAALHALPHIP